MVFITKYEARLLTPVAAVFGDPHQALCAADNLRRQEWLPRQNIDVLHPDDPELAFKMRRMRPAKPAPPTWQQHLIEAVRGAAAAAILAAAVLAGWLWESTSAQYTLMGAMALGTAIALGLAGLLRRPSDNRQAVRGVEQALREGLWAVVAHAGDRRTAFAARNSLLRDGGAVLQPI